LNGYDLLCRKPIKDPSSIVSKVFYTYVSLDETIPEENFGIMELALSIISLGIELMNPTTIL
jgi:hypothetical protein